MPFEGAESKNNIKILVRTSLAKKLDFDEIWNRGVFEGADFQSDAHFYVECSSDGLWWALGSPVRFPRSSKNRKGVRL